jgi:putative radical SAM enzyme (TIGR03279 family)
LYGNFITLTNLKQSELQRIADLKLSPLYVSVHTTDENLRKKILNNKNAGKILKQLNFLLSEGIEIHTQAVLCPGINDGKYLDKTIKDLSSMWPGIRSLALVPVGLTKFNKNNNLRKYTKEESQNLINKIKKNQQEFLNIYGTRFVFLADEFYLKAGFKIPEDEYYEDYSQLENGIGLARLFMEEIKDSLPEKIITRKKKIDAVLVTGESSQNILHEAVQEILKKIKNIDITVKSVKNDFFGSSVTVAGLLTGSDIIANLKEFKGKDKILLIPNVMLKNNSDLFLDDIKIDDISKELNLAVKIIKTSGKDLVDFLAGEVGV